MGNNNRQPEKVDQSAEFAAVKDRLDEIARAVDDENLSLDDALDLYEEAVKLGLQASNLLEVGIVVEEGAVDENEQSGESSEEALVEPAAVNRD